MGTIRRIGRAIIYNIWPIIGCALVLGVIGLMAFRFFFVTFVDKHELGFSFDRFSGKIERLERTGWVVLNPVRYDVNTIDLRPYQVTINANARILNAKLIRFNSDGLETFVEWHGRDAGSRTYDMLEILKCYAFDKSDGKDCPFLTVVSEISPAQSASNTTSGGGK